MDDAPVVPSRPQPAVRIAGPIIRGVAGVAGIVSALFLAGSLDPHYTTNRVTQTANLSPATRLALLALGCLAALLVHVPRRFALILARAIWLATLALGINALFYANFFDPDPLLVELSLGGLGVAIALSSVVDRPPWAPSSDGSPRRLSLVATVSLAFAVVLGIIARTSPSPVVGAAPAITTVSLVVGSIGIHRRQAWGAAVVQTACMTLVGLMAAAAVPIAPDFEGLVMTSAILTTALSSSVYYRSAVDAAGAVEPRVRRLILTALLLTLGGALVAIGVLDRSGEPQLAIDEPGRLSNAPPGKPLPPIKQVDSTNVLGPPEVYDGPDGPKALPLDRAHIVNVWLQGCQDCMPSFNAWKRLYEAGDIPRSVPIVNVAYGNVDPAWAEKYGVRDTLLTDDGRKLVNRLTIRTFTTLVISAERRVVWIGYPKDPDYLDQLKAALAKLPKE